MYGDNTKSLILDGIRESRQENLTEIIHHCINDINVPLRPDDIENAYRIGRFEEKQTRPRPVKVTFHDPTIRDQIFYFKPDSGTQLGLSPYEYTKKKERISGSDVLNLDKQQPPPKD